MFMSISGDTALELTLLLISFSCGCSYNLDTQFPIIYSGSKGSYFGYTTALHSNRLGPISLVGAPRSNTTTFTKPVYQPGTLYRCNITEDKPQRTCQEIFLMTEGAIETNREYDFAYRDKKDGMWLGISLDVRRGSTENDIVTCGHLWKNQYHAGLHLVNGVCYIINGDLEEDSVRKLLPLTERAKQYGRVRGSISEYNHAHGQAGMSAAFSEDGSNLILGAPGVWSWSGSIVYYPITSGSGNYFYGNPDIPSPPYEINYNSYFGYSVTTGKFYQSKTEFYAVGAPRDGRNNGKIYIIRMAGGQMNIHQRKGGVQLGEYFGGSVLGVNLNGDSFTDLLVGAPLNSLESAGDEGKVYVYISNGNDLQKDIELTGDRRPSGRFGTALASVGDINQDGFDDIAIGAPYEGGTGAIYIYHGSRSGVRPQYAQKITAASTNSKLSGFGIHISRGLDIDDNGYPDILVGSYSSSNAVLFRSRPVIHVFPEIIFTPKQINMNQTMCTLKGKNITCFQVDACLWYTGKHVPSSLAFLFLVTVQDHRAFFDQNSGRVSTSRQRITLDITEKICSPFQVYLQPNIKDVLTPIPVQFSHKLIPPAGSKKKFDETFPIYHPSSPTNITSQIMFQTGCGEENECHSDLTVTVTRTEPAETGLITLGKISRVSIVITVANKGEPAYLSELFIYLPPEMPSINEDICESGNQHNNASLICSLGNPLRSGTQVEIHIKLDATKIPPHTKYLEIACQAVTLSTEMNPDDNVETLPFHLETISDIGITGISVQDQVLYEETQMSSPIITHTYIVRNHGPSPLQAIDISLRIPYAFITSSGQEPFVYFTGLKVDNGLKLTVPAVCEDSTIKIGKTRSSTHDRGNSLTDDELLSENGRKASNPFGTKNSIGPSSDTMKNSDVSPTVLVLDKEKGRNKTESSHIRGHLVIDCNSKNIQCITLRCSASPFTDLRKFSQLSIGLQLNFTIMNKHLGQWYQIAYVTTGLVSVRDSAVIQLHNHPDLTQVKTLILHEGPPPPEEISPWIVFVSVGVGVILLVIILIILIKVGFFKRKEKDRMKEMQCDAGKEDLDTDQITNDTAVLE